MTTKAELKVLTMLRSLELTRDMESRHLRKLASIAKEVQFEQDEIIYRQGDKGRAVYLIQEGNVVIETVVPGHGQVVINTLTNGQFFGWSSFFPFERKMAWTRAVTPVTAFAFDASRLQELCEADHSLQYAIGRRAGKDMINRIKFTRQQLADLFAIA